MKDKQIRSPLSPDKAVMSVEQKLFHAADQASASCITIHARQNMSACNIWECVQGTWIRILPELVQKRQPGKPFLVYELERLKAAKRREIVDDLRWEYTLKGLAQEITRKYK